MSMIEDDEEAIRTRIVVILFILLSVGLISFGIFSIVTKFSFSVDTTTSTVDYYKGRQAVGQGIIDISFGIASIAGLYWYLRQRTNSETQYRINRLIAILLLLGFIVTLIAGTFVLFKII